MPGSGAVVAWGGGSPGFARARQREGATIVSWPGAETAALDAAGLAYQRIDELLSAAELEASARTRRSWARVWARLPIAEGRSFRDLVVWRGESLLWACEGFLWQRTAAPRCAATAELCLRLLSALQVSEVDECGLPEADALLLSRAATVQGILFHGEARCRGALPVECDPAPHRGLRRLLGRLAHGRAAPGSTSTVAILCSNACLPPPSVAALEADPELQVVRLDLAELDRFETTRTRQDAASIERQLCALHATLAGTPALAASYAHRGVVFHDLAAADLEKLLRRRLPQAVRRLEQTVELLQQTGAGLLLVDAAVGEEPRLFGLAARALDRRWAVLRHEGAAAPEPERADGGPQPAFTVTLGPQATGELLASRVRQAFVSAGGSPS